MPAWVIAPPNPSDPFFSLFIFSLTLIMVAVVLDALYTVTRKDYRAREIGHVWVAKYGARGFLMTIPILAFAVIIIYLSEGGNLVAVSVAQFALSGLFFYAFGRNFRQEWIYNKRKQHLR